MRDVVIALYECTGYSVEEWAKRGFEVHCFDLLFGTTSKIDSRGIRFHGWDARDPEWNAWILDRFEGRVKAVIGCPPCTDLAVSGAKHFPIKFHNNPQFQEEALELVLRVPEMAEEWFAPWVVENPVSVLSTKWRKPDFYIHPYEYGGYLPRDDVHPLYPNYINPRDSYPKKTCLWVGGGMSMPTKKPVPVDPGWSKQQKKLGGKSDKTKAIRSASPRGLFKAICLANYRG